ncbi:unnamed protein product [Rotaria sp. Silwood2]|nr:unnamed protein product [Rotaria sp. Silwood2]CAF3189508.1 unnamed protein product [Rotaria sp. Silwood2]CAF3317961.1 unnamed protein product [Rotaria sp. Silwood2]CAF3931588.1 unnamed protein product [Rotaria sp. Silwood2]CAF4123266.1 unnamed protein product [Rotaria sp. Silwood2]
MNNNRRSLWDTPSFGDNQGRWYELLSPTQVLSRQEQNDTMDVDSNNSHIIDDDDDDDDNDHMLINETEELPSKYQLQPMEEQILSQKLSQLTTSPQSTELRMMMNENGEATIPDYLGKESQSFEQLIIAHVLSTDKITELRQMAILMYQYSMINLQKSLWMTYWKAGMGQFKLSNQIGPQLWPLEVQSKIEASTNNENKNDACQVFVSQYLSKLDNQLKQHETELLIKRYQLSDYIEIIETFVRRELEPIRLYFDYQMAIVEYNYHNHILSLEYLQHNPTYYQAS